MVSRCKTRNPLTIGRGSMVALVYCGSKNEAKKKLDAIIAREAKKGYKPKDDCTYAQDGRVHIGSVTLVEA